MVLDKNISITPYIITKFNTKSKKQAIKAVTKTIYDGIWINRTRINKVTFLSHEEILRVCPLTVFDTEYDPPQGIGVK